MPDLPAADGPAACVNNPVVPEYVQIVDHRWRCTCSPPFGLRWLTVDGRLDPRAMCIQDLATQGAGPKVLWFDGTGEPRWDDVFGRLGSVHTLQRSGTQAVSYNRPVPPSVSRLVDYLPLSKLGPALHPRKGPECDEAEQRIRQEHGGENSRYLTVDPTTRKWHKVEFYPLVVVPSAIKRYNFHVSLNQVIDSNDRHDMMHDLRFQFPPGLMEFTLVLWPYFSPGILPPIPWALRLFMSDPPVRTFASVPPTLVCLFTAVAASALAGKHTTVVGADRLSPVFFGQNAARAANPADMVNKVKEIVREQMSRTLEKENCTKEEMETRVSSGFDRIRFLSLEDWWVELGEPRRRYEGLALGSKWLNGHEHYSRQLVEE